MKLSLCVAPSRSLLLSTALVLSLGGCVLPPPVPEAPPATPNFVFQVPSTAPAVKPPMTVAILQPKSVGSLFVENVYGMPGTPQAGVATQRTRMFVGEMLHAEQADLERIIIAKGFPSAGTFPSIEEMTFSQKEKSSLILLPDMEVNVDVVRGGFGQAPSATIRGTVALQFLEPMSREKVWVKRIELPPITKEVPAEKVSLTDLLATNRQPRDPNAISQQGMVQLLNAFYAATMTKIWEQLDPREIQQLKQDADKLKGKTNYRG